MPTTPIESNCIPPKNKTITAVDVQPWIDIEGSTILPIIKKSVTKKLITVMNKPAILEKYSGFSVNELNPVSANFTYFLNENVDVPV